MSNGDEEDADSDSDDIELTDVKDFETKLQEVSETIDQAETEWDLEDIEDILSDVTEALDTADILGTTTRSIPQRQEIREKIEQLQKDLNSHRSVYVEDIVEAVEDVSSTIQETRWTEDGIATIESAVTSFLDDVEAQIDRPIDAEGDATDQLGAVNKELSDAVNDPFSRGLDAEAIDVLLTEVNELEDAVEAAESWEDLSVREQLTAEGFYEILSSEQRKDFPPEWSAIKLYEKEYQQTGDETAIEMILLALDKLPGGNQHFMEENILDTIERIAPPEALDAVLPLASKRQEKAIQVVGKIGDPEALDTILEFIDGDGDVALQLTTLQAVGAIGSEEATQTVANRLVAEESEIRGAAARALGRIGDTRAIEPLADVLSSDPDDSVRASAAWALIQIGTERALEALEDNADEAYLVQAEAEKAPLSS